MDVFQRQKIRNNLRQKLTFAKRCCDDGVWDCGGGLQPPEKSAKSVLICVLLAERFHRGDRTTDDPTDYAANGIPAAHPQTAKRATGDTDQDVADRMLGRSQQDAAASAKVGRNSIVRNHTDNRQRDRARAAIRQHAFVQTLHVSHELLCLAVRSDAEAALP